MNRRSAPTAFLVLLALVFTIGLSFASVELPYLVDRAIMDAVPTLGFDNQADEVSRIKTELFVSHYHLRTAGYVSFGLVLFLIIVGFATRRSGLAFLGGLAFMLPVFAQFAGVMFFLAGLGLLNVLWLPVLDISYGLSGLGAVIRAPYDLLRWLLGLVGVEGYWPIVYSFLGSGLLIFFLGTLAWLQARARKDGVAESWVYRLSRHPQYLGWILWSYGIFLLLLQARYPRRSWGISPSLPWLLSTLVILGVAMLEELTMKRKHGEAYESYRNSTPFMLPLPRTVERLFVIPLRLFFGKDRPERRREVVVLLGFYAVVLIGASALFYQGGAGRLATAFRSEERQREYLSDLVREIRQEDNWRRQLSLTQYLGSMGDPSVPYVLELLADQDPDIREYAALACRDHPSRRAVEALAQALADPSEDVRWHAVEALGASGSPDSIDPLLLALSDSAFHIRISAVQALASLKAVESIPVAMDLLRSEGNRERVEGLRAFGTLGASLPAEDLQAVMDCLTDEEPRVREEAVIALLRIGSPDAIPSLRRASEDPDGQVRMYATEALKRLDG